MKKHARAFTLFEMVVVVAIFVLLAGGIYATVNAAVRATATLSEENLQIQRLNAFVSLLRRTFHNLPANAVFSGGVRSQDGDGLAADPLLRRGHSDLRRGPQLAEGDPVTVHLDGHLRDRRQGHDVLLDV